MEIWYVLDVDNGLMEQPNALTFSDGNNLILPQWEWSNIITINNVLAVRMVSKGQGAVMRLNVSVIRPFVIFVDKYGVPTIQTIKMELITARTSKKCKQGINR